MLLFDTQQLTYDYEAQQASQAKLRLQEEQQRSQILPEQLRLLGIDLESVSELNKASQIVKVY
ncbi:MAG: hypothetical protein KME38_07325 [Spirirestis rafaelensis WJT71-NPBG6]|nr:hypothetical protein [Spirirestis rafaelensis WJT71-NPBG6]